MRITDYLKEACIDPRLSGESKAAVIEKLLGLIVREDPGIDGEQALKDLDQREELESTAIGSGIAIPHARIDGLSGIKTAFGLLKDDPGFEPIDRKPVQLVFVILFPKEDIGLQLRFLARTARLLHNSTLRDDLLACTSAKAVFETFRAYEEKHFH